MYDIQQLKRTLRMVAPFSRVKDTSVSGGGGFIWQHLDTSLFVTVGQEVLLAPVGEGRGAADHPVRHRTAPTQKNDGAKCQQRQGWESAVETDSILRMGPGDGGQILILSLRMSWWEGEGKVSELGRTPYIQSWNLGLERAPGRVRK